MKQYILVLVTVSVGFSSCGQEDKAYSFPEFHLTFRIPSYFNVRDSFPKPILLDSNHNFVTDTAEKRRLESNLWKGLLILYSPDSNNTMSINIVPQTSFSGDIQEYYEFSKTMQEFNLKNYKIDYDTIIENFAVDNIRIKKFITVYQNIGVRQYSGFYIGALGNSFFLAKVEYIDTAIGRQFENILNSTRF